MRGADEALGDDRDGAVADRDLQAVGTESRGTTACAGRPGDGSRPRSHRCAGTAPPVPPRGAATAPPAPPDGGAPPVRERADADALPGREAVEQRSEWGDGAV